MIQVLKLKSIPTHFKFDTKIMECKKTCKHLLNYKTFTPIILSSIPHTEFRNYNILKTFRKHFKNISVDKTSLYTF